MTDDELENIILKTQEQIEESKKYIKEIYNTMIDMQHNLKRIKQVKKDCQKFINHKEFLTLPKCCNGWPGCPGPQKDSDDDPIMFGNHKLCCFECC